MQRNISCELASSCMHVDFEASNAIMENFCFVLKTLCLLRFIYISICFMQIFIYILCALYQFEFYIYTSSDLLEWSSNVSDFSRFVVRFLYNNMNLRFGKILGIWMIKYNRKFSCRFFFNIPFLVVRFLIYIIIHYVFVHISISCLITFLSVSRSESHLCSEKNVVTQNSNEKAIK